VTRALNGRRITIGNLVSFCAKQSPAQPRNREPIQFTILSYTPFSEPLFARKQITQTNDFKQIKIHFDEIDVTPSIFTKTTKSIVVVFLLILVC